MTSKTITVTLTSDEVDTLEDMLWCTMSEDEIKKNHKLRSSLWEKICSAFDKEESV